MDTSGGWAIWFTGLPGSGKTTLARAVQQSLQEHDISTVLLDSDEIRRLLHADKGYSSEDRNRFYQDLADLAMWLVRAGAHVLIAATANLRCYRQNARAQIAPRFAEVWVRCSIEVCRARDPKGLYKRAEAGQIQGFPGVDAPYEEPEAPEVIVDTDRQSLRETVKTVIDTLHLIEHHETSLA
jgi:adenylyl-sulfate kinase